MSIKALSSNRYVELNYRSILPKKKDFLFFFSFNTIKYRIQFSIIESR